MSAKRIFDIVATCGTYKGADGTEKKKFMTLGGMLERDDGSKSIKFDCIPIGWDGWASLYPPREKNGNQQKTESAARTDDKAEGDSPF